VWFQRISTPPPQRVIGNSEEEGVLEAKIFKGVGNGLYDCHAVKANFGSIVPIAK